MLTPVSQLRCLIAAIPCPLVDLVDGGLLIEQTKSMFFLWVKQCHKPSMTGNGLYLPPIFMVFCGMVCYCFRTILLHI